VPAGKNRGKKSEEQRIHSPCCGPLCAVTLEDARAGRDRPGSNLLATEDHGSGVHYCTAIIRSGLGIRIRRGKRVYAVKLEARSLQHKSFILRLKENKDQLSTGSATK